MGVFALFVLLAFFIFAPRPAPPCSDLPGSSRPCAVSSARDLLVYWARPFPVSSGVWSAVAYVENPNQSLGIGTIAYRFKLYDDQDILVAERDGQTAVPPNETFAVFEGGIGTGVRVPVRALFEFLGTPLWRRELPAPDVSVSGVALSSPAAPRIDATLQNRTSAPVANIESVVIVYGTDGNAIGVSKTAVPYLEAGGEAPIFFTWGSPFPAPTGRIEILSREVESF